ncbi:MAG: urea amidolyase family protein [Proteobacteria bacterium]|nr:urea amidolyase family protein [Pseudomonadota bacterium]
MVDRLRFLPAGDDAFLIELGDLAETLAMLDALRGAPLPGVMEAVPAARTLFIRFNPDTTDRRALIAALADIDLSARRVQTGETFEIPVVYDGEDLSDVADILGCSVKDLVARHMDATYTVAFTGFAPGFAYMTCDDPTLDVPRRKSPRVSVPAGAVALGGKFCGIYPSDSPGGWQLLGRTPVKMWDTGRDRAALLAPGDRVRFHRADMKRGVSISGGARSGSSVKRAAEGLLVTRADRPALFQDLGRPGHADQGVGESGALDRASFIEANLCVGNSRDTAALEVTFGAFGLKTDRKITLAVTGAPCALAVQSATGRRYWAPLARPFELEAGDDLLLEPPSAGMRSYIALRGGFDVTRVLSSAATDTLAKIGPAPVVQGDLLAPAGLPAGERDMSAPGHRYMPKPGNTVTLDVILGPRTDWFTAQSVALLFTQEWKVTAEANRVGIRLAGALPLERCGTAELPSEATAIGSIQVPHSGQPVLFLADRPLTGGYPVIGVVARHHLDLCGQLPGGVRIRFKPVAAFAPFVRSP